MKYMKLYILVHKCIDHFCTYQCTNALIIFVRLILNIINLQVWFMFCMDFGYLGIIFFLAFPSLIYFLSQLIPKLLNEKLTLFSDRRLLSYMFVWPLHFTEVSDCCPWFLGYIMECIVSLHQPTAYQTENKIHGFIK